MHQPMARQSVEVPEDFKEIAESLQRTVNWLAQIAFREFVEQYRADKTKERTVNANSNRNRRR